MDRAFAIWITAETGGILIPSSISFKYLCENPVLWRGLQKKSFSSGGVVSSWSRKIFHLPSLLACVLPVMKLKSIYYIHNRIFFNLNLFYHTHYSRHRGISYQNSECTSPQT